MEIPALSRISGFNRLQNTSFISRILDNLSGIQQISQIYNFWTLGALIFAFLVTFTRFNFIIFRFHKIRYIISQPSSSSLQPLLSSTQYSNSDESDDETCSSSSSSSSSSSLSELDEKEEENMDEDEENYRVAGSSNYEENQGRYSVSTNNRFTWSDFANGGRNVVKSWPDGLSLGLGLGLEKYSTSGTLVSMWDNNNSKNFNTTSTLFFGQSKLSPSVIVSAGLESSKNVALRVWDTRVGRHIPEIFTEWQPCWKKVVGNNPSPTGCLNNNSSIDVRKIRNVKSPTESNTLNENNYVNSVICNGNHPEVSYCLGDNIDSVVSKYLSYLFYPLSE